MQPGERVELLAGTCDGPFISTVSGTRKAPVVIAARRGDQVIINSNGGGPASALGAIQIDGESDGCLTGGLQPLARTRSLIDAG